MSWFNVEINANKIEARTERAVLIKMNNDSDYSGFAFWHPAKLLRTKGGNYTFSFNEDFNFNLIKNGNGKYNRYKVIDEATIDYQEMLEQFGVELEQENDAFLKVEEPKKVNKEVKVADELVNE